MIQINRIFIFYTTMKQAFSILLISILFMSCQKKIAASDIAKINGYWEIEKVLFPDGNKKEYKMNETYDYFNIKYNKGFRQKVSPQLDGTFLTTNDFENVEITATNGKYYLNYSTPFAKWKEELISLSDAELVTLNDSKKEYHYKKAAPINIIPNGKKTQ